MSKKSRKEIYIHMCNYSKSLKITLQITDENIKILDKTDEIEINGCKHLVYYGVLEASSNFCPYCQKCKIINNGYRKVKVKMPSISDKPAILYLNKHRFICRGCRKSFTAETTEVRKNSNTSKNLRAGIIKRLSKENTLKEIAESCAVSTNTVLRIQCDLSKTLERPKTLPVCMCFDEVSSTSDSISKMSFVYADALTHKIQNILQGRTNKIIKDYFLYYSYQERCKVKAVVIDMNSGYKSIIRELFPNAKIVIDRFHIVQLVNRAFNKYRVSFMNSIKDKNKELYRQLKCYWKNLLTSYNELDNGTHKKFKYFKYITTEQDIVNYLIKQDSQLYKCYWLIQDLREALEKDDFDSFKALINDKSTLPRYMFTAIKTLRKYKRQIKNTMYYNGLSNGPLEGINNKIKVIKRISYGYKSFSNFKAKILLVFSLFTPSETNKKPRYSKEERQAVLAKKKEIRLKRKNRKKAILLNIA